VNSSWPRRVKGLPACRRRHLPGYRPGCGM